MLGFAQEDQTSTDNNTCYLPFDFSFDCFSTPSESLAKHPLATEDETPIDSIALQPSLIEFRAQQRACSELGEIIDFLENNSSDKLGQKVADRKLRSLQVKCKNCSIDPTDVCLKYYDAFAEHGENYLFVVPVSLRRQFLYAHHNAPLSGGHRG